MTGGSREPGRGGFDLERSPLIGILRRHTDEQIRVVAEALIDSGLRHVEVTLDSEGALEQIATLVARCPDVCVGVGSVLTPDDARAAIDAGAAFVVMPVTDPQVIEVTRAHDVPAVPGAATPTEILLAWRSGATAVKVFPAAQLGGPEYVSAIRHPLGGVPVVPTGGVSVDTARPYLEAGAVAVGAGSSLFDHRLDLDIGSVRTRIDRWVAAVAEESVGW